ncbi:MAG: hypothetical protein FWG05_02635, partial [Kiritimatiellaeota bacterium]|nr:hypothetical protein [Kiritimatiellota bacterium]
EDNYKSDSKWSSDKNSNDIAYTFQNKSSYEVTVSPQSQEKKWSSFVLARGATQTLRTKQINGDGLVHFYYTPVDQVRCDVSTPGQAVFRNR